MLCLLGASHISVYAMSKLTETCQKEGDGRERERERERERHGSHHSDKGQCAKTCYFFDCFLNAGVDGFSTLSYVLEMAI